MKIETEITVKLNSEELNALCNVHNMLAELSTEEKQQLTKGLNSYTAHVSIENVCKYLSDLYELAGGNVFDLFY